MTQCKFAYFASFRFVFKIFEHEHMGTRPYCQHNHLHVFKIQLESLSLWFIHMSIHTNAYCAKINQFTGLECQWNTQLSVIYNDMRLDCRGWIVFEMVFVLASSKSVYKSVSAWNSRSSTEWFFRRELRRHVCLCLNDQAAYRWLSVIKCFRPRKHVSDRYNHFIYLPVSTERTSEMPTKQHFDWLKSNIWAFSATIVPFSRTFSQRQTKLLSVPIINNVRQLYECCFRVYFTVDVFHFSGSRSDMSALTEYVKRLDWNQTEKFLSRNFPNHFIFK